MLYQRGCSRVFLFFLGNSHRIWTDPRKRARGGGGGRKREIEQTRCRVHTHAYLKDWAFPPLPKVNQQASAPHKYILVVTNQEWITLGYPPPNEVPLPPCQGSCLTSLVLPTYYCVHCVIIIIISFDNPFLLYGVLVLYSTSPACGCALLVLGVLFNVAWASVPLSLLSNYPRGLR